MKTNTKEAIGGFLVLLAFMFILGVAGYIDRDTTEYAKAEAGLPQLNQEK